MSTSSRMNLIVALAVIMAILNEGVSFSGHSLHGRWKRKISTKVEWVHASDGLAPENSVHGGQEVDEEQTFVCRVTRMRDLLPGKLVPSRQKCYVAYGGKEFASSTYQVLTDLNEESFSWVQSSGNSPPAKAVVAGSTYRGRESLYICRFTIGNALITGKYHPSHRSCYVPYGGKERSSRSYEVLVFSA